MMLVELIICDLAPPRQRGMYLGIVMAGGAFGAIVGPVIGGALASRNWRWCFYMNLPICAVTSMAIGVFLRVKHTKEPTWTRALARIDWIGNIIFIGSSSAILLGLVFGGSLHPWSSFRVILPICLGSLGGICFFTYQASRFCQEPLVPPRIFENRTSAAGFCINFVSSITLQWVCLVWPIYFQGVRQTSPLRAGINFIPFEIFLIFTAPISGALLTKYGAYRPLHLFGFALSILGPGLNIQLSQNSSTAIWAALQAVDAVGRAFLIPTILPAILSSLPDSDTAVATGMYSFLRSFGWVWGLTLPGIIFDTRFDHSSTQISDPEVRQRFQNGGAYQLAGGTYFRSLIPTLQDQVVATYKDSLRVLWIAALAFGFFGLLLVPVQEHIPLRKELNGEFGLQQVQEDSPEEKSEFASGRRIFPNNTASL
jgi:MFS family permease